MASSSSELLLPRLKTKAKRELQEQPEHIDAHVESFRRWITSLPHITFPCEHHLLIPFLRYAKYNHAKAQQRLDNFCTIRASKELGAPRWFDFPPLTDPLLDDYLKSGVVLDLGRTTEDLSVILIRLGNWNMDVVNPSSLRCFSYMDVDRFLLDPVSQIAGFIFLFDLTGVGKKHFVLRSNQKEMRLETKVWRDAYPIRVRHVIYYNEPKIMDIIFKLVEIWMSSKVRERIIHTKNSMRKAYDKIPGLQAVMPAEYSGYNENIEKLIEQNAKKFHQFYQNPSSWQGIQVDETKRPNSAKNLMSDFGDAERSCFGTEGTYVQFGPRD